MRRAIGDLLACVLCRGRLSEGVGSLTCSACGRIYVVRDGIPDLLLQPPADTDGAPGLVGRTLAKVVATPIVYDVAQQLAGAKRIHRKIRPILEDAGGAVVLDAGGGTGSLEALLPRSAQYLWLDPDPKKLDGFRMKSRAPGILGDATSIPLRDRSVDWAVSVGVSHHLDDQQLGRMLDELRRVVTDRLLFLDAVATPRRTSRLLWCYDPGRHPRAASALKRAIATRFRIASEEQFTLLHRYLLVTAT